jgi:hypothetical protein
MQVAEKLDWNGLNFFVVFGMTYFVPVSAHLFLILD